MYLGEKIRFERKRRHMMQKELANLLGVKLNCISKWEIGRVVNVPAYRLSALSDVFHVPVSYFVDDDIPVGATTVQHAKSEGAYDDRTLELVKVFSGMTETGQKEALRLVTDLSYVPRFSLAYRA